MILDADISARLQEALVKAYVGTPIAWKLISSDFMAVHQARVAAARFVSANQPVEPRLLGLPYSLADGDQSVLVLRRRDTGAVEEILV